MEVLQELSGLGVSIWLDDLSRSLVRSGRLADLVRDRCVVGVTSNPTIFATALADGQAYDSQVGDLAVRGVAVGEAVRALTCADVRDACDVLRPTYAAPTGSTVGSAWRSIRGWPATPTGPWPKPKPWRGSWTAQI